MSQIKRILVPVDFGAGSGDVIEQAFVFALAFGSSVDLLHVWQPLPDNVAHGTLPDSDEQVSVADRSRILQEYLTRFGDRGVELEGKLETGSPAQVILDVAAAGEYGLIVMGTHGRHGLAHMLKGQVTERIVRGASCPVLSIHVPEALSVQATALETMLLP